jgi:hypothetical protein
VFTRPTSAIYVACPEFCALNTDPAATQVEGNKMNQAPKKTLNIVRGFSNLPTTLWGFGAILVAAGVIGAHGAEYSPVGQFKIDRPTTTKIFVCPPHVSPSECNAGNATDVIFSPWSKSGIACGVQSQQLLAGTGVRMRDGQYIKVVCAGAVAESH